jgi:hypothetical protein
MFMFIQTVMRANLALGLLDLRMAALSIYRFLQLRQPLVQHPDRWQVCICYRVDCLSLV